MANRSFRGRGVSVKRKAAWDTFNFGRVNALMADGTALFSLGFAALLEGTTIVRLRGELLISSTLTSGDSAEYALGIGITSAEAFAVGVTALPSPITDGFWPGWFVHQWCSVGSISSSTTQDTQNARFELDSKAMRKFVRGQVCFAVVEMDNEQTTGVSADLQCNARVMVKLS